jgi:hypothetical protein
MDERQAFAQRRLERLARQVAVASASHLAWSIVTQYPDEDRAMELAQLELHMQLADAMERSRWIELWLKANEPEAWDDVAPGSEERFLNALESALVRAIAEMRGRAS